MKGPIAVAAKVDIVSTMPGGNNHPDMRRLIRTPCYRHRETTVKAVSAPWPEDKRPALFFVHRPTGPCPNNSAHVFTALSFRIWSMAANQKQLAKLAGVSAGTVSNVISGSTRVSESSRQK